MTETFNVSSDHFMNATSIVGHDDISADTPLTITIGDNNLTITNTEDIKKYFIELSSNYNNFYVYWFVVMNNQLVDITITGTTFTINGVNTDADTTTPKLYQLIIKNDKTEEVNFISNYNKASTFKLIKHCYNIDGNNLDIFNNNFFNNEDFYIGTLDIFYTSSTYTNLNLSQLQRPCKSLTMELSQVRYISMISPT